MQPIVVHSHDEDKNTSGGKVVHLSTQAGNMTLRENSNAPGYEVLTPQKSSFTEGTTTAVDGEEDQSARSPASRTAGLPHDRVGVPGGGSELANAESLGGASQAAHTARLTNIGGKASTAAPAPATASLPTSAGAGVGAGKQSTMGRLGSSYSPAQAVGPGAAGLASARGVDSVESSGVLPSQFVFPKLGARRLSEQTSAGPTLQSGHQSPISTDYTGMSTPDQDKASSISSAKHKKKDHHHHHNPLVDLRRVSLSLG